MSSSTVDSLPHVSFPLQAADDAALEAEVLVLFDECAGSLNRYVRGCGLPADAADDVVQETFIALFRHLRLDRPRDNLRGWLFTVAHRQAQKYRQRTARRGAVEYAVEPAVIDKEPDGAGNPETLLTAGETIRQVQEAFQELPERHRQCLLLRAQGLRYRQIAQVLGISLGGVAKTVASAVLRLSVAAGDDQCT